MISATPQPLAINTTKAISPAPSTTKMSGERKFVSVLFADLSGFTAMSEKLDPEKVTEIINSCFNRLGKCVYSFEGYIDKFMGDCIMALFGAPIAHENDPELAIRCALAMMNELQDFNRESGQNLGMSIGINSGLVVAGQIGTDQKLEYTVMGDAVNLAQRLESVAKSGEILVSESIFKSCQHLFDFQSLDPVSLKGKERPVQVFLVNSEKQILSQTKGLSSENFIGREKEFSSIEKLVDGTLSGAFSFLGVAGEAGVGKSRLKLEVKRMAHEKGLPWYEAKCDRFNRESPYFLLTQLLTKLLEGEDLNEIPLDDISIALLKDLLHLPTDSEVFSYLDANQKKQSSFLAIRRFLEWKLKGNKCLLYLEDLHWIDPLSLELLDYALPELSKMPLLLYSSFRPDFHPPWENHENFSLIKLEALTPDQAVKLTKSILRMRIIPRPLELLIREKSDGNPLYVEEILKSLVDQGLIIRTGESYQINADLSSAEVPATLQGLIASRIDKLDLQTKLVLQYASVMGRQFEAQVIESALGRQDSIGPQLQRLQERGLIFELKNKSKLTEDYVFKHALTQEVAYQSILLKDRKKLHEQVGLSIEAQLERLKLDDHIETLARHFMISDNSEKAFEYSLLSARHLAIGFNNEAAIKHYLAAIEIFENKIEDQRNKKTKIDLWLELAEVYVMVGDFDRAEEYQKRVLALEGTQEDPGLQSMCFRRLGDIARFRGKVDEMLSLLDKSLHLSHLSGNQEGIFKTYKALGYAHKIANEHGKALEYLRKALEGARSLKLSSLVAECLNDISTVHIALHELDLAEKSLTESIEISTKIPRLKSLVVSSTLNLGVVEYYRSNFERALTKFQDASTIAHQIGDLKNLLISKHNVGEILREFGRDKDAIREFQNSYEIACDMGNEIEKINNLILIGYLRTRLGETSQGEKILIDCIEECKNQKYWLYYSDALFYLGKFYTSVARYPEAKESFLKSKTKAFEIQAHNAVHRCDEEIAKIEDASLEPVARS